MEHILTKEQIEKVKDNYKESTYKTVLNTFRKIHAMYPKVNKIEELIKKEDIMKDFEKNNIVNSTLVNYMFNTIKVCKLTGFEPPIDWNIDTLELKRKQEEIRMRNRNKRVINHDVDAKKICDFFKKQPYETSKVKIALFSILSSCPVRLTELSEMTWQDDKKHNYLDLNKKHMLIRNHKNGNKPRIVRLTDDTVKDIQRYLLSFSDDPKYVFTFPTDMQKSYTATQLQCMFRNACKYYCKKSNIKYESFKFGIHEMRSVDATKSIGNVLNGGAINSEDLLEMIKRNQELGHSLIMALKHYTSGKKEEETETKEEITTE